MENIGAARRILSPDSLQDLIRWAHFIEGIEMQSRRPALKKFPALRDRELDSLLECGLFVVLEGSEHIVDFFREIGPADLAEIDDAVVIRDRNDPGNDPLLNA